MTPSEDVLRDLLLEHGIEGVTLWHIKALAVFVLERGSILPWHSSTRLRLNSDLRGEEVVLADAYAQRAIQMRTIDGEHCVNCGSPATTECWSFVGSFVCGQPLCANCKHKH